MGYEDRDYNQDMGTWQGSYGPDNRGGGGGFGGAGFGGGMSNAPRTIVMTLIIINVVIFFLDSFTGHVVWNPETVGWETPPEEMKSEYPIHALSSWIGLHTPQLWRVWTFVTYGFSHASLDSNNGIWHLIMNMVALFFLGRLVEMKLGRHEFLKFYLAAIVFAGVAYAAYNLLAGADRKFVVGASGAVVATVMLFVFMFPREKVMLFVFPMPAWLLGILVIASDFFNALNPESHVAWQAHMAGAVFATAYFFLKWNFNWVDLEKIPNPLSSKPNLKIHDPDLKEEKIKEQGDQILAKISEHGEKSLTGKERRIMAKYSKLMKKNRN